MDCITKEIRCQLRNYARFLAGNLHVRSSAWTIRNAILDNNPRRKHPITGRKLDLLVRMIQDEHVRHIKLMRRVGIAL